MILTIFLIINKYKRIISIRLSLRESKIFYQEGEVIVEIMGENFSKN